MKYRVTKSYRSPYPDPLVFHKGEQVAIRQEYQDDPDWVEWVWCEGSSGMKAWTPKSYLTISGKVGFFLRDYNARELSVSRGEIVDVGEILGGFGLAAKPDGDKGWVPLKVLERC